MSKSTQFKNTTPRLKTERDKSRCFITGKKKLSEEIAKRRAASSDDIKGGMAAYSCIHAPHWHVGHSPYSPKPESK